eukprot:TRINITY_DN8818_c0_g1_i1.p1 TRINITY_DN8818_c0_g1~~TRINITY_DN8818_c0_g1_i1.p1  ORF type:complete len:158 (+),score=36.17 TRINITY_DN8818_c0_g1_i1:79-552(+)
MADLHHPEACAGYVPQRNPAVDAASSCVRSDGTQDLRGIELPNPNLVVDRTSGVDYIFYPLRPAQKQASALTAPSPDVYQRLNRRPWDITMQQFCRTVNKRRSIHTAFIATLMFVMYPMVPREKHAVDTGVKRFSGLSPSDGIFLPGPSPDRSFAGN